MKQLFSLPLLAYCFLAASLPSPVVAAGLSNPLGTTDLNEVFARLIKAVLGVSGGLALLMFIWGGFLFLTAGGNDGRIKKGKETLTWAIIGIVVILAAYILVSALINVLVGNGINAGDGAAGPPSP